MIWEEGKGGSSGAREQGEALLACRPDQNPKWDEWIAQLAESIWQQQAIAQS